MDSIKSKMKSLSEATLEATKRANTYEEETMRVNEQADKLEEQVCEIIVKYFLKSFLLAFQTIRLE